MDSKTTKPMPTEAGIRAFHERCKAFYPADAVNAPSSSNGNGMMHSAPNSTRRLPKG